MCLWFFRTWLGLGGAPPDIRRACFFSDCTFRPGLGLALEFLGIPCLIFQWLSFRERVGCPLLSSRFVTLCSGPSLAPRLAGFTVPARPTRDKSQRENVISCGGGQVFLVRLGGASSAVRAVHIATGCSVKVGSSILVSFWLRKPGHGGADSQSRSGLFCVPWARCTRAVAPCLLCEELPVILVDGGGFLRGFCFGTFVPWFLAPFYWCCGWRCRTWVDPVLLAWTYHCFRLGAWSLGLASSSVTCHPSPSHGLARLGGLCMSPLFEMLSFISWKYWISFLRNLSFLLR